jgi:hypothetical protein
MTGAVERRGRTARSNGAGRTARVNSAIGFFLNAVYQEIHKIDC